jgi:hypothetical protein
MAGPTVNTKAWASIVIAAYWALLAAITFAATYAVSYVGAINAPFADEWLYTNPQTYAQPLSTLFNKHGSHPFVIGRIGLALDYWLFDAQGWALRATSFVLAALAVCAVAALIRQMRVQSPWLEIVYAAFAVTAFFSPLGEQNFSWGFQFTFVLAFTAAFGAIAALAAYADQRKTSLLILATMLSATSTLSLANGLLPRCCSRSWLGGLGCLGA